MPTRETFAFCCLCGDKFWLKETCKYCDDLIHDMCNGCSFGCCSNCETELYQKRKYRNNFIGLEENEKK